MDGQFDITGSIKVIEWLKTELLGAVTSLYRALLKGARITQDELSECLAEIIILTYLLGRRLGVEFSSIDSKIQNKLKIGIMEKDDIEKDHGDLSKLLNHMNQRK